MPVTHTTQDWSIGSEVKIGWMILKVTGFRPTPGDYAPDAYLLESLDGSHRYEFVPHMGLNRLDTEGS